jgi:hypothetical protein
MTEKLDFRRFGIGKLSDSVAEVSGATIERVSRVDLSAEQTSDKRENKTETR